MTSRYRDELIANARKIASPGKGILAADESTGTIGKRFESIGLENNVENRRAYRDLLFSTKTLGEHISGAILYEETLYQKTADGSTPFTELLAREGILVGIKLDKGMQPLNCPTANPEEVTIDGIDGLGARCAKYYADGARFAKWRGVLHCNPKNGSPTAVAISENATRLARYASICQANGLVPIVEPEVLMDGTHTFEEAAAATERTIRVVYEQLALHGVLLEGTLLKPNMVRQGEQNPAPYTPDQIAEWTLRTMQRTVPAAVPGITFLSGGMSEEEATVALNALNSIPGVRPWNVSFSYGRALQASVIKTWKGSQDNLVSAQKVLLLRARANGMAQLGKYDGFAAGDPAAQASLHVTNYVY